MNSLLLPLLLIVARPPLLRHPRPTNRGSKCAPLFASWSLRKQVLDTTLLELSPRCSSDSTPIEPHLLRPPTLVPAITTFIFKRLYLFAFESLALVNFSQFVLQLQHTRSTTLYHSLATSRALQTRHLCPIRHHDLQSSVPTESLRVHFLFSFR